MDNSAAAYSMMACCKRIWEDGRVFSMELQATNSPGEIDFEEYEPYDDEASQRVITDLQRSIAGLAWR